MPEIPLNGGLITQADPEEVGIQGCTELVNAEFDKIGRLYKRSGRGVAVSIENNVIKTLSDSNAGTLIIDNSEHEDFYQKSTPHVYWGKENIDEHQFYGYQDKEQKTIIVGKPNQSFINNLLTHFGWTLEKVNYYNLNNLKGPKTSSSRCCSTWIR